MKHLFEEFKEYIVDIISIVILILASIFLFNKAYYEPLLNYNETIDTLSSKYHNKEVLYYNKLNKKEEKVEKETTTLNTIPKLLTRINNTCKAPEVIIRTLIPSVNNPFAFELKFISNYFDFLTVLSEFEKLNININKIDIKPYEIKKNNSKHIITLNIEAIDGGEMLSESDIEFLEYELNKKRKRDPFQRFAKIGKKIKRLVDLTWMYKLSGVGKINGKFTATIDHRIYYIGSIFNDMKIINIDSTGVNLVKKTKNGNMYYILNFRNKAKEKNENK
jgi:hypothetical protein